MKSPAWSGAKSTAACGAFLLPATRVSAAMVPLAPAVVQLIEARPKDREIAGQMVANQYVFTGRGGRPIGDFSQLKADLEELSGVPAGACTICGTPARAGSRRSSGARSCTPASAIV